MSVKTYSDKQLLEQLSQALQENMALGKVDIKTLANQLSISTCQLNRRVKEATGHTTSDYVLSARLAVAKRLLAQFPEITIFETAQRCGFADTAHFSHAFKRKEGLSPTQFALRLRSQKFTQKE